MRVDPFRQRSFDQFFDKQGRRIEHRNAMPDLLDLAECLHHELEFIAQLQLFGSVQKLQPHVRMSDLSQIRRLNEEFEYLFGRGIQRRIRFKNGHGNFVPPDGGFRPNRS